MDCTSSQVEEKREILIYYYIVFTGFFRVTRTCGALQSSSQRHKF